MSLSTSLPSSNGGFRDQSVARPKVFWVSALKYFFNSSHVDFQKFAKSGGLAQDVALAIQMALEHLTSIGNAWGICKAKQLLESRSNKGGPSL